MIKLFFWKKQKKYMPKSSGMVLLVTMIIGSILVTLGLGAAQIIGTELQFSADFYHRERAFFAAESGVEKALSELETKTKVRHIETADGSGEDLGNGQVFELDILSRTQSFNATVNPEKSVKFLLQKQNTNADRLDFPNTSNIELTKVTDFSIDIFPVDNEFRWKVMCEVESNNSEYYRTTSIQNNFTGSHFNSQDVTGIYDNPDPNQQSFTSNHSLNTFLNNNSYKNCLFSVENKSASQNLMLTFNSDSEMSRHSALIQSKGKSGNREKHIIFEYFQNKTGALFDFGLYHTDNNLSD